MSASSAVEARGRPRGWALALGAQWDRWAALALLLLLWGRFLSTLVLDWKVDPQYAHGWFIPLLALILVGTRWATRPPARPAGSAAASIALLAGALLLLTPLTFLQAVYPEARPFQWAHGLLAAAVTFALLLLHGGRALARHFAFPIVFMLLAVPWPRALQNQITDRLMHGVAATTVEVTLLGGVPAMQQGNAIGLAEGTVGIDEACSGVRSLQGSIILALFLGSYFPMRLAARVALLAISVAGSLILNVLRAAVLVWICAQHGAAALDRFHDPAGFTILAVVFAVSVFLAHWFSRRWPSPAEARTVPPRWNPSRTLGLAGLSGVAWLGLTDLACFAYFGPIHHEEIQNQWQLDLARTGSAVTEKPISPTARQFLRYDTGAAKELTLSDGTRVQIIDLQWHGGEISAAGARLHHPTICLPNIGYRLDELLPSISLHLHGLDASFDGAVFETGNSKAYVYHALWEDDHAVAPRDSWDQSLSSAIRAVKERRRLAHARVLMLMFIGPEDARKAGEELESLLAQVVVPPAGAPSHGRLR